MSVADSVIHVKIVLTLAKDHKDLDMPFCYLSQ